MQVNKKVGLGFTLVEMAIVLVVVGLLITGLILPLSVQKDLKDYQDTRIALAEIKEALIGYSLSHSASDSRPYLPCPDTNADGLEESRDAGGICSTGFVGDLPWATLGLGKSDSWNRAYIYQVSPAFSNNINGFNFASLGNLVVLDAKAGNEIASEIPAVMVSKGKNGDGAAIDEVENSNGDSTFVSHEQIEVAANQFDDMVVWLPTTVLFHRMVAGGRLP